MGVETAILGRGSARCEIARLVMTRGEMSKVEIEAALDYSHPTVINAVGSLVADGILKESGEYDSTGGRRCYCGKKGCADAYLSALRLSECASSLEDFFARLEAGDASAKRVWGSYLDDLALMVTNLRMAFDRTVVVKSLREGKQ